MGDFYIQPSHQQRLYLRLYDEMSQGQTEDTDFEHNTEILVSRNSTDQHCQTLETFL